jgi:exopolysaccharide biosynthesis predicted pyruvyltransferase EpsI
MRANSFNTVNVAAHDFSEDRYSEGIQNCLSQVRHCQLVFKDQLLCIIFLVITQSFCLFVDNNTRKRTGVFNACLSALPHIEPVICFDPKQLEDSIGRMLSSDNRALPMAELDAGFSVLSESVSQ